MTNQVEGFMYEERDYGSLEGCEETICRGIIDIKIRDYKPKMLHLNICYYILIFSLASRTS